MLEHKDPKEQEKLRKLFTVDVKKHIDAIAKKYILPDEGTFDFALMYIPAENVYYEMIVKDESEESIASYGLQRHVIPVSPNSFNIYLHTILLGLRGMQIEKSAKDILGNLTRLKTDFERFGEDYQLVGKHLSNARTKFEDSEKRLDRLNDRFGQIAAKEEPKELAAPVSKE
jgi:DNA recombination protein RmuC